jgi:hypothetical protein
MSTEHLISADEFCVHHQVDVSFIHSLHEFGLLRVVTVEQNIFIDEDELDRAGQFARLHHDLSINTEGLDAIHHLLNRMDNLRQEVVSLQNRLRRYESAGE